MRSRHICLTLALIGGAAVIASISARAQTYPTQTVRMIVPFAAGGLNDTAARLLQPGLEKSLGQAVIVDNRPAASGIVGTDAVAKAAPDGHSLLVVASTHAVVPATNPKVPYNIERDLAAVVQVARTPLLFVVNAKVPAKTLPEFVALAKKEPGKYNYASPGAAGSNHLVTALFSRRAGIAMQHVPYRGGAPAIQSLVAGDTHFAVFALLVPMAQIKAGNLRVLAVGGLERDPEFPDVPTVAESGYPGFEATQWVGILTTGGTPKPVIDRLNAELNKTMRDTAIIERFEKMGVSLVGGGSDDFQKKIVSEYRNWVEIAREANITAE
ncbi:MAG TPA: tripartite tricarboxylate transporter substrate binding protein [Xanthobacteraceae bacterium]|nr:tripartite tricarboxylate transporter substrate binding protein [Xanthobacteraceae bacterium]